MADARDQERCSYDGQTLEWHRTVPPGMNKTRGEMQGCGFGETKEDLHLTTVYESGASFPTIAADIVKQWAVEGLGVNPEAEFYVVWFSFTLGNWKALVSSTEADARYYEITHRVNSGMVFVDTYRKTHNNAINVNF